MIQIKDFQLGSELTIETIKDSKAPRHHKGEHFLKGPIPLNWLMQASKNCPSGRALDVAMIIWYLSGINNSSDTIKFRMSIARNFGLSRHSVYRAFEQLEKAYLIEVSRKSGRNAIIKLLDGSAKG